MQEPSVIHNTFVIERRYPKSAKTVFAAFADADKKRRWYAEGRDHELQQFELDFREGGVELLQYRMNAGTPVAGMIITHESRYLDIVPDERIVLAGAMDVAGKRIQISLVTAEFLQAEAGADLILTVQGIYLSGGLTPQMIEAGWRTLLDHLEAELVQ
jgi:uncharacterized protein YndB with AHSA1/START domain